MYTQTVLIHLMQALSLVAAAHITPDERIVNLESAGTGEVVDLALMSSVDESDNHMVYVMRRDGDDTRLIGSTNTGGLMDWNEMMLNVGSSTTFNSQGGMVSDGRRRVVVANTNSNSISLMAFADDLSLVTRDVVDSLGERPCSVAMQNDTVCALNCGGEVSQTGSVVCFNITPDYELTPISDMRAEVRRDVDPNRLFPYGQTPSEIQFSEDGSTIIVASKDIGFQTFRIDPDTQALTKVSDIDTYRNDGGSTFAFSQVGNNNLIGIAPRFGTVAALDTFKLDSSTGALELIEVNTEATAYADACWSAYRNGYLFVGSPDMSRTSALESFRVAKNGTVELVDTAFGLTSTGRENGQSRALLDIAVSDDGKYVYGTERIITNAVEWQTSARDRTPIEERVRPRGYSYVVTFRVEDGGKLTSLGKSESGRLPLAITGAAAVTLKI